MAQFDPNIHVVSVGGGGKAITWPGLQARLQDQSKFIEELEIDEKRLPDEDNDREAIVKAKMIIAKVDKEGNIIGRQKLQEFGDASAKNVGPKIVPHTMRMACTRAEARCLRIATRSEYVAYDEIGGSSE